MASFWDTRSSKEIRSIDLLLLPYATVGSHFHSQPLDVLVPSKKQKKYMKPVVEMTAIYVTW